MTKLICKKSCSTCQKVEKTMQELGIDYDLREIDVDNPTAEELKDWWQQSGLPITRFINTSGILYREKGLSEKRKSMTEDELLTALAEDGMLVKRPILFHEDKIYVGPDVQKFLDSSGD